MSSNKLEVDDIWALRKCRELVLWSFRPSSSEQTSSSHRHSDIFDSFQSLKLKSSPQPKVSPAMSCLQGYYGLKPPDQKAASERFEMAVYSKGGSHYLEDGPFYKSSPLSNPPLSLQRKSKSVANGFMSENGVPANHLSTQDTRDNVTKLKALKTKLKDWSKSVQGNLRIQKQLVLAKLAKLEEIQEHRTLQDKEIVSRMTLLNDFEDIARKEEIAWQQRSGATWLNEGDRNTNFFYKTVNAHRRTNTIDRLKVGERWRIALGSITVDNFSNFTEEKDSLVWQSDIYGKFSVNSAYRALNKTADQETDMPWRMIWKPKVPDKVNCFLWLMSKEAVLTHENLKKRGYHFSSRCTMCGEQAETINHLFLHCKWTEQLWRMFFYLKGITWVKPGSIKGVLNSWFRDDNASTEERWKFVPACVCWTIWKERNNRSFEYVQNSLQKIKMNFLALLYFWCKQDILARIEDIFDVLDCLQASIQLSQKLYKM
ncbi:hypothetical protein MTR67_031027 [Solanum verrucosum]|uniref:Reverse transcriptase zinc-binding domain-containing protein n=1 Tax=Solanum verrucosum TaxID=315347 RepID=A0AAF0U1N9_SOLVR|nr:hypothetical protein MTR67_031027 [Solanum verrucosum]